MEHGILTNIDEAIDCITVSLRCHYTYQVHRV